MIMHCYFIFSLESFKVLRPCEKQHVHNAYDRVRFYLQLSET